jgi:hypothetical protein
MKIEVSKNFHFIFLFIFIAALLSIHFSHTEKYIHSNDTCVACHFQNSTLVTSQIHFFYLPPLFLMGVLRIVKSYHYDYLSFLDSTSRSPPEV